MSKQVEVKATCGNCGCSFKASLFRSIWGENPENRAIVFNDTINVMVCPHCKNRIHAPLALLYVDMNRQFAVWYEPEPDPMIDDDTRMYAGMFGPECFYVTAPRISDWQAFKHTILQFEQGQLRAKPVSPTKVRAVLHAVAGAIPKSKRGCLVSVLFLFTFASVCATTIACWLVCLTRAIP